mgnify:CR=1 FL=1
MLKLLKNMRRKEVLMVLLCTVLVAVQVYFDLRLPDYMTDLTTLIKTSGATADILSVGAKMLGCTLASAVLAVGCGYLAAKAASGFSFTVREKLFRHVMDIGSEEMQDFSVASLITRTTNDITQIQMIVAMGLQMMIKSPIMAVWAVIKILGKSWELSAVTATFVVVICVTVITGDEHLHPAFPHRAEADRPDQPCGARKSDGHQRGARVQRRAVPERQVQQAEP